MEHDVAVAKSSKKIIRKWFIAFKIMPILILIASIKFISHKLGLEVMELNALFTSLVAGTVFLIGFLISGVLSDYKESEKIPGELTASIRSLSDDLFMVYKGRKSEAALRSLDFQRQFVDILIDWLYKKGSIKLVLHSIAMMDDNFIELEKEGLQANYIIKMKNEQNNIRKLVIRIDTIRETEFVGSAYAIVEAMGILTAFGLIIIKIEPFYASLFLTLIISFLISYMFLLIKDLDNPFDYSVNGETGTEISLRHIHELKSDLESLR